MSELKVKTVIQKDENISKELAEREFLRIKLEAYVKSNTNYEKASFDVWQQDYTTRKNSLLTEYIMSNFTLREIGIIFCREDFSHMLESDLIKASKRISIRSIDEYHNLTAQERKRLKKKVWDMPKILYGLVHELIHMSDVFYNEELDCHIYPDI